MHRHRDLWIAASALVVAVVAAVIFVAVGLSRGTSTTSVAAGETIYRTGAFDGQSIPRASSGGGMMGGGMMGGGMRADGCASCHGLDGHGRTTPALTAPNITYANLTDPKGMLAPDGSRGPTYTGATLRRAITTGIDPTGSHLDWPMPQWQLSDQEWDGLLAYLKTLR
jgi:mono/diheme cytochrome c family protein